MGPVVKVARQAFDKNNVASNKMGKINKKQIINLINLFFINLLYKI